jgi:H+/gluconate symporter-like permease
MKGEKNMLGVFGSIISLLLLMYLAYKGISVLILAPILALLAAFIGGGTALLPTYTEVFMTGLAGFVKSFFPLFLLGAIFGKVMDDSGAAKAIAHTISKKLGKEKAILAVIISCAVLTYGGVSLFVVAFAVYPLAAALFREAGIPKRLIPASIALGSFTFTMTALPGTPQIQNAIPMDYFNTNTWAAPILGTVAALIMFVGGSAWIMYRAKVAMARGEGYGNHKNEVLKTVDESKLPGFAISMAPIVIVLVLNYILSNYYFTATGKDWAWLAHYKVGIGSVAGTWSLIISLVIAILVTIGTNWKRFENLNSSLTQGASGSVMAILNTASQVGYGSVISSLAAFAIIRAAILGISQNPLVSEAISVNILAGITGSASGGMRIALVALGKQYMEMAQTMGINPQALHRIATISCGGLDSLPHNGAVITLLAACGLTHKESYADIGMVSVIIPIAALVVALILATFGVV